MPSLIPKAGHGVLRLRSILNLSMACPSLVQARECGDGVPQRPAELADLPPWQDCVPPPQTPSAPASIPIGRSSNCVPGAEHCRGSCGAGVPDDRRNPRMATDGRSIAAAVEADVVTRTPVALSRVTAWRPRLSPNNTCFRKGRNGRFRRCGIKHLRGRILQDFWNMLRRWQENGARVLKHALWKKRLHLGSEPQSRFQLTD